MEDSVKFDSCINYQYSFSIFNDGSAMTDEQKFSFIKNRLAKKYNILEFGLAESENDPVFSDLGISQNFLHADGLPFECRRLLVKGLNISFPEIPAVKEAALLISIFSEFNVAQVMFCFTANGVTTDELIYLRHIFVGAAPFVSSDGYRSNLEGFFQRIVGDMGCGQNNVERTYLVEIKKFGDYDSLDSVLENEKKRIYGIMCGDEGWEYVPDSLAAERVSNIWGSRNFVRFIVFGSNAMLLNMAESTDGLKYVERQRYFGNKAYGSVNPYFLLNSSVAGINHGILFAQELVMVIKSISNRILSRHTRFTSDRSPCQKISREIRHTQAFRGELIKMLNRVEKLSISEVGELEQLLLRSHHISPLIENIKYMLELLESELNLLYQESTNRLVNFLTVAGLLLTVVGLLAELGFFSIFS